MNNKFKIFLIVIIALVSFMVIINVIPPKAVAENNLFITSKEDGPMLAAHRGGKIQNPENTIKAFDCAVNEYDVDILEMDLCLTKDEKLVIIHNLYINDYCDVEEVQNTTVKQYVNDYTYEELLNYNFGYNFISSSGDRLYKDLLKDVPFENRKQVIKNNNLNIVLIDDLFARYYETNQDLLYIVEVKNGDEIGYKACDILNELLTIKYPNLLNRVVIGTFHTEIEQYLKENCSSLLRGASVGGATSFIITQMFKVNIFDNASFVCLQIPTERKVKFITLDLTRQDLINRAHKRNIAVQYWTINDVETMNMLIDLQVDAIMTDDIALLHDVLVERNYR